MSVPNKILFINDWTKGHPYAGAHIATEYLAMAIEKTKILTPIKYYLPQPQRKKDVIKDGIICLIGAIKILFFSIFEDPLLYGYPLVQSLINNILLGTDIFIPFYQFCI